MQAYVGPLLLFSAVVAVLRLVFALSTRLHIDPRLLDPQLLGRCRGRCSAGRSCSAPWDGWSNRSDVPRARGATGSMVQQHWEIACDSGQFVRLFEGLVAALYAFAALGLALFCGHTIPWRNALRQISLPVVAVLIPTGAFILYYNHSTTGKLLLLPYELNMATYSTTPVVLLGDLRPELFITIDSAVLSGLLQESSSVAVADGICRCRGREKLLCGFYRVLWRPAVELPARGDAVHHSQRRQQICVPRLSDAPLGRAAYHLAGAALSGRRSPVFLTSWSHKRAIHHRVLGVSVVARSRFSTSRSYSRSRSQRR